MTLRFGTYEQLGERIAARPAGYLADLERIVVKRELDGLWIDTGCAAYQEMVRKYDGWQGQAVGGGAVDVVVVLADSSPDDYADLRFALRSFEKHFLDMGSLWVVGGKPSWLRNARHVEARDDQPGGKDACITHKLEVACREPDLSEQFVFLSDDQVLLQPSRRADLGPHRQGAVKASITGKSRWERRLAHTRDHLAATGKTTWHGDTHTPIPMEKARLLAMCDEVDYRPRPGFCVGTLYLNWTGTATRELRDGKLSVSQPLSFAELHDAAAGRRFLGHSEAGMNESLRSFLADLFPEVCRYEEGWAPTRTPVDDGPLAFDAGGVDPQAGAKIAAFRRSIPPYPAERFHGRGIVTCAGGDLYQANAYVLFRLLRHLGCTLPVECWYDGQDESDPAWERFVGPLGVRCVDARAFGFSPQPFTPPTAFWGRKRYSDRQMRGYALKPLAVARSSFEEVLFLDADNGPQQDPTFLFDCPDYQASGDLFWPDVGNTPNLPGFGLPPMATPGTETGQFMLDKRRRWDVVVLAEWFCQHAHYFFRHSWGDKDVHFAAALCCGRPLALAPRPRRTNATATMQHAPDGSLLFLHRTAPRAKWPTTGEPVRLEGDKWHDECRQWLEEWRAWNTRRQGRISLAMVVCNEESRLRDMVLDTRPCVDEVVIVVQESQDRTLEIAREVADVVIEHPCHGHCSPSTPELWRACTGEWVLRLDADERLAYYAKAHLREWTRNPAVDFYLLREVTTIDGTQIDDSPHARLCRRSKGVPGTRFHNEAEPVPGAAVVTLADEVAIEHHKTTAEQEADNQRYSGIYGAEDVVPQNATA